MIWKKGHMQEREDKSRGSQAILVLTDDGDNLSPLNKRLEALWENQHFALVFRAGTAWDSKDMVQLTRTPGSESARSSPLSLGPSHLVVIESY